MKIEERIQILKDKDLNKAYKELQELENLCLESDECYDFFDEFLYLIQSENYYQRIRGIRMICSISKWDKDNKIDKSINEILSILDDEKPSAVRQALSAIEKLVENKKRLRKVIKEKVSEIDCNKYKESMSELIQKDIDHLILKIEYEDNK